MERRVYVIPESAGVVFLSGSSLLLTGALLAHRTNGSKGRADPDRAIRDSQDKDSLFADLVAANRIWPIKA